MQKASELPPNRLNKSFSAMNTRLVVIIFALFSAISAGMIWYTKNLEENAIEALGLQSAMLYSDAIAAFRTLYTSEVVATAERFGLEIRHDYVNRDAIPLPATLSILLGNEISNSGSGASARLYSPYPFPWRQDEGGLVDEFDRNAWDLLVQNPGEPYYEFSENEGESILRYAVADTMRPSCVGCHNTHPDTPKSDWQVDDVRGILEVTVPLATATSNIQRDLNITIAIYVGLSLLGIIGIMLLVKTYHEEAEVLRLKNEEIRAVFNEIKTLRGIIPICSYCHQIRDDQGAWDRLEDYISKNSEAQFSHGICPKCLSKNDIDIEKS